MASVMDVNGNVVNINHDTNGNPTGIVSPFGEVTSFSVDGNGYVSKVTDAANNATTFTYSSSGLMQSMTDARGGLHQFAYDSQGRLTEDQDPAGGSLTLAQSTVSGGFSVNVTTALQRTSTYHTTTSADGTFSRANTFSDGTHSSLAFSQGAVTSTTSPDGTTTTESDTPDPRFGMLSAVGVGGHQDAVGVDAQPCHVADSNVLER
jgi:YD repeat-containing protein